MPQDQRFSAGGDFVPQGTFGNYLYYPVSLKSEFWPGENRASSWPGFPPSPQFLMPRWVVEVSWVRRKLQNLVERDAPGLMGYQHGGEVANGTFFLL